LKVAAE